jgi:hypothetical protein
MALVRVVYKLSVDVVMTYDIESDKDDILEKGVKYIHHSIHRYNHMLQMVHHNLVLVVELGVSNSNERHVQVVAPFEVLCEQAEVMSLRVPLTSEVSIMYL